MPVQDEPQDLKPEENKIQKFPSFTYSLNQRYQKQESPTEQLADNNNEAFEFEDKANGNNQTDVEDQELGEDSGYKLNRENHKQIDNDV